jgi:hypothetical protein
LDRDFAVLSVASQNLASCDEESSRALESNGALKPMNWDSKLLKNLRDINALSARESTIFIQGDRCSTWAKWAGVLYLMSLLFLEPSASSHQGCKTAQSLVDHVPIRSYL